MVVGYATMDDGSARSSASGGSVGGGSAGEAEPKHNPLTTVALTAARNSVVAPLSPVKPTDDEEMALVKKDSEEGGWPSSALYILIVEFCERLSFYGATIVFYPYMKNMLGWDQSTQNVMYNAFNFWAYFSTVIGGFVADTWTGKVTALFGFSTSSLIGLACLVVSSVPATWSNFPNDAEDGFAVPGFVIAIFFLGLGTGGIKSNVSTLMADQIGSSSPSVYAAVFRWFYWAINLGAFLGILATPVLHNELGEKKDVVDSPGLAPEGVPEVQYDTDGTGYWASYGMPFIAFCFGITVFAIGHFKKLYIDRPPKGSLITECYRAAMYARQAKREAIACGKYVPKEHWLDWAESSEEYAQVGHDFKLALVASKVFFFYPLYWLCYNQMFSNLVEQAELLDRPSWLQPESLNVVGSLSLILLIPVFDKVVFPALKRWDVSPSLLTRIPIGYFFGALSIAYCGMLEYMIQDNDAYKASPKDNRQSDVIFWYQLPPYVLFGISEIFASVGGLEYAYTHAPPSMKSVVMSLFLLTNAASSIIGMLISPVIEPEKMVEVYFSLSGTLALNMIIFVLIYHPKVRRRLFFCC